MACSHDQAQRLLVWPARWHRHRRGRGQHHVLGEGAASHADAEDAGTGFLVQGLSVQARDGTSRAGLEAVITCAMAAWDTLASADR